jgi:hypothetical protein
MVDITEKELGDVMGGFLRRSAAELLALTQEELFDRWHFRPEPDQSVAWNIYQFSDNLESYKRSCRRWEEHHNGSCCVVERVRDKYLMPEIKKFEAVLRERLST